MRTLAEPDPSRLANLRGVFADIDETISTRGKITPGAFDAMWRLHEAGLRLIPVTGRSAGWCDHIARFWPVTAVVGENGGFYFHHDGRSLRRRFLYDDAQRSEFRRRLENIGKEILASVPGCAIASDQRYREYDLAIDFCEDVAPLPRDQALRIRDIFQQSGARAKISSIHVNGWFGDFDKLSSACLCAKELLGVDLETEKDSFAFCGDSPNDEPMFAFFPLSFAMANVRPYLDLMERRPAFITSESSGAGFVEVVDAILRAKQNRSMKR
jgi:hypothetical protein